MLRKTEKSIFDVCNRRIQWDHRGEPVFEIIILEKGKEVGPIQPCSKACCQGQSVTNQNMNAEKKLTKKKDRIGASFHRNNACKDNFVEKWATCGRGHQSCKQTAILGKKKWDHAAGVNWPEEKNAHSVRGESWCGPISMRTMGKGAKKYVTTWHRS